MKIFNDINRKMLVGGLCSCLVLASCSDSDPIPNVTPAYCAEAIELNIPEELQQLIYTDNTGADVLPLVKGEAVTLGYTISPDDITNNTVVWTSSDQSVASVEDGTITALSGDGNGYSIITVAPVGMFSGSGVSSALTVRVDNQLISASDIAISASADEVYEGETVKLSAEIEPAEATYRTVKWTSSDESIATVAMDGTVTGVAVAGGATSCKVTITATALDGSGTTDSYELTVKRIVDPEDVTIDQSFAAPGYLCAVADKSVTLDYTTYPADCTTSLIEWTSSDESIATVKDGVVTFNQSGNFGDFTITATCPTTGKSSSVKMSMPAGLIRELFHDESNYTWNATNTAASTWHYGRLEVTTMSGSYKRQDFKCYSSKTWICPQNYPIFAVKMDDVKDQDGVTARNITFDTSGKNLKDGTTFRGGVGGNNNKWVHDYKCSDGSHVLIYDFRETANAFATGGTFPADGSIGEFTTFQFKYADIKVNGADATKPMTYNIYWVQTFKTTDEIEAYLDSEGITYEKVK